MATLPWRQQPPPAGQEFPAGTLVLVCGPITEADESGWLVLPNYPEKCIQFFGTFGGGTIVFQGTNDPAASPDAASILTLTDPQGNGISKTAAAIEEVLENPLKVRAKVTAGTGVSLTAILLASTVARR